MRKLFTLAAALLLCAASYAAVINVYTTDDLTNAVAYSSDTIRLRNDIVIKDGVLSIPAKKTCVIDLNNHFIRCDISKRSDDFLYAIKLRSDANLTLINGEVACNNTISDSFFALIQTVGAVYLAEKGAVLNLDGVSLVGLLRGSAQPSNYGLALGEQNNLTVNARFSDIKGIRSKNSAYTHTLNMYHVTLGDEERKTKENGHGLKVDNGDNLQGQFAEGDLHGTNLSAAQLLALIPENGSKYYTISGGAATEITRAQVAQMSDLQEVSLRVLVDYNLTVANQRVITENCNDILGDGKVRFDYLTNTLYLETKNASVLNTINGNIVFDDFKLNIVVDGKWKINGRIVGHDGNLVISAAHPQVMVEEDADYLGIHANSTPVSLNGKGFTAKHRVAVYIDDNNNYTQSAVSCGMFAINNAWFDAWGKKPVVDCQNSMIQNATIKTGSLKNNDVVQIEPNIQKYVLFLMRNIDAAGTVCCDGYYPEGTEVSISATANSGYHFLRWDDGVTDNPRTVAMTQDVVLTAIFEADVVIPTYTVNVVSADETMGTVSGGGTDIPEGTVINITAMPKSGYEFLYWTTANGQVQGRQETWTVTRDETLTAHFRTIPDPNDYMLWVCGTQVSASNSADILGDGVWCYDHATRTLSTMKMATYNIENNGFIEDWVTDAGPLTVVFNHLIDATCTTTDNVIRTAIVGTKGMTFTGSAYNGPTVYAKNMYLANFSDVFTVTGHITAYLYLQNTTDFGRSNFKTAILLAGKTPSLVVNGANLEVMSGIGETTGYKVSNKTDQAANLSLINAVVDDGSISAKSLYISDNSPKYQLNYITPSLESLCQVGGFGEWYEGTFCTLRAYPQTGYKFVSWSDGNTDNPRYMVMPAENVYLDPIVEVDGDLSPKGAIINANATEGQGSIVGFESGWYAEGTELTITAVANDGYAFVEWTDGTTDNPYHLTVVDKQNVNITAAFKAITEGVEQPTSDSSLKGRANKVLINGILYIERNGKLYNAQGAQIR